MSATVEIVIPVYNEEKVLSRNVVILHEYLKENLENPWRILIADNGSTDDTLSVAKMLAKKYSSISYLHVPQKGRGRALRTAWIDTDADIVSYMDVDLSTHLKHFPKMIHALEEGFDIVIGSRLARGAQVKRSKRRSFVSRSYNKLIGLMFSRDFTDAQCGFKALHRRVAEAIIPLVINDNWFFDTELLIVAGAQGCLIKDMPVEWTEDPDSSVKVVRTAFEDIKGLLRLRFKGIPKVNDTESSDTQ